MLPLSVISRTVLRCDMKMRIYGWHRRWWPHCTMLMFVQSMSILRKFIPTHSLRKRQLYGRDCQGKSRTRNGNQGRTGKAKRKEEPYGRFSDRSQEIGSKSRKRNEAVGGFNGRTRKRFGWKTSKDFQTPANGRRRKIENFRNRNYHDAFRKHSDNARTFR